MANIIPGYMLVVALVQNNLLGSFQPPSSMAGHRNRLRSFRKNSTKR